MDIPIDFEWFWLVHTITPFIRECPHSVSCRFYWIWWLSSTFIDFFSPKNRWWGRDGWADSNAGHPNVHDIIGDRGDQSISFNTHFVYLQSGYMLEENLLKKPENKWVLKFPKSSWVHQMEGIFAEKNWGGKDILA